MKLIPEAKQKQLVAIFDALGDRTRYRLLQLLQNHKEICVSELAEEVGISSAGVSQQLKVLEQAGLVERHRIGQKICYQVVEDQPVNKSLFDLMK